MQMTDAPSDWSFIAPITKRRIAFKMTIDREDSAMLRLPKSRCGLLTPEELRQMACEQSRNREMCR
jgi:hypothetical protein